MPDNAAGSASAYIKLLKTNDIGREIGYYVSDPGRIKPSIGANATMDIIAQDLEDLTGGRRSVGKYGCHVAGNPFVLLSFPESN